MRKISLLLLMLLTLVVLFGTGVWGQEAAKPAAPAASAAPATPQAAPPVTTTQPAPEATKPPVNEPAKVAPAAPEAAKPEPKGKLAAAIAQTPKGTEKGQINPDAPKGFMGIPGAPSHLLALVYPLGNLGRLDFFFSRRLWRRHGRCRSYLCFRIV